MNIGYLNENKIIWQLHKKSFAKLTTHWQQIIKKMFNNVCDEDIIKCRLIGRDCKTDIEILIGDNKYNVSIKSGLGVSVHYEHLESFLEFLKLINISEKSLEFLRKYQYGIIDNNINLLSTRELKKVYKNEINIINEEFNKNNVIEKIVYRCIIKGRSPYHQEIDYLYYGNEKEGQILSKKELISYIPRICIDTTSIHFGPLMYQAANRNVNTSSLNGYKKDYIQIKWRTIEKDIASIINS